MNEPSLKQKLRYRFDNFMARGGSSIFIIIIVAFLLGYLCLGLIRTLIIFNGAEPGPEGGFFRQIYITFLQMTAPGNMNQDIHSSPWLKVSTILAGVFGIVLFSALIGFITTSLRAKLDELQKGRSKVIETDHSLILGWNEQRVVEIIRELVLANESEDNPAVVILADKEKEVMDDFLSLTLPSTDNTRVVTRSGSTSSQANLRTVSAGRARSAIILASASDEASNREKARSDAQVIKSILALSATRGEENELNIVAELFDSHHQEIIQHYSPHPIGVANSNEILAKIIVQTSRSIGLSVVYGEILSFDGCEMYFHEEDDWRGISFGDAQFHFPDGVPMGIATADGELLVNPPKDRILGEGDEILILAEDDSTIEFLSEPVATAKTLPLKPGRLDQTIENELIIGWNKKGHIIVEEYAEYVLEGSSIHIIVNNPSQETQDEIAELNTRLSSIDITLIDRDPLQTDTLMESTPSKRDNIIILNGGDDEFGNPTESDAQTILILLLLRKIFEQHPDETINTRLITEVMDSSNQNLISKVGVKDFIISNRVISMLIAQMSEEARIKDVYDILFKEDGSEIYLKPLSLYFETIPDEMSFADCMAIAQEREEICLGVKIKADEAEADKNFGVKLIPEKSTQYKFGPEDCLVVLSEDET